MASRSFSGRPKRPSHKTVNSTPFSSRPNSAHTRVCALFGRELKGVEFTVLWEGRFGRPLNDLLAIVADEAVGVVAGATGRTGEGYTADLELLLLPLRH